MNKVNVDTEHGLFFCTICQASYVGATYCPFCAAATASAEANDEKVKSPAHYSSGRLETIYHIQDALGKDGFKAYCLGNTIKYLSRHMGKNGEEDLRKAYIYLGWVVNGLPDPVDGKVPK